YSKKSQITNINYITSKPYFFKDTIISNLKLVNNSDDEIKEACKLVNVYDTIKALPDGFNSPIDILSQRDQYLLSVARTLLIHGEIVIFYEFPSYLSEQDDEIIKNVIELIKLNHTVIIFSATNKCNSIADKIYNVKDGRVKLSKHNTAEKEVSVFDALDDYDNTTMFSKTNSNKKGIQALLKRYAEEHIIEDK
ncbi:MAG: hypothetical protein ACLRFE_03260, partial [Clostridia bacterium]